MLQRLGLPLIGHHHRGIDDSRNIAAILRHFIREQGTAQLLEYVTTTEIEQRKAKDRSQARGRGKGKGAGSEGGGWGGKGGAAQGV